MNGGKFLPPFHPVVFYTIAANKPPIEPGITPSIF
jgi:hypothetical protein